MTLDSDTVRRVLGAADPAFDDAVIRPVPNWGGFVNRCFEVRAGPRRSFLKLADDPVIQAGLRRWHAWGEHLATRYRAPRTLAWLDVPGTAYAGLLLEWLPGSTPKTLARDVVDGVAPLLDRLHTDATLRDRLAERFGASRTCAARYRDALHDRFVEDLEGISAAPPPFLEPGRLRWMGAEAERLHGLVSSSSAFDEPADCPVHGDPWLDNLIVGPGGGIHVTDWDDLAPGDPVHDWAIFLGPGRRDLSTAAERPHLIPRALGRAERERLALWSRATALDWVIDPLADWVEADPTTSHGRDVRRANARLHGEAFARYVARHAK